MKMGYEIVESGSKQDLWSRYRDQFAVVDRLIYLNHAAVAPLCRRAAEAMKRLTDDVFQFGSLHYNTWLDAYEGLRVAASRMIHAHRDEIAIVKNTSEGISTIALGLDWKPGDKIVCFEEEFPANLYPWRLLEKQGVRLERLSIFDPMERVDEACRGARLLAISYVQYLSGYRIDLEAFGEICRRHGTFFFLDAIQGMGVFPIDVQKADIHALAADGHKWLLGPEGCGILYVRKELQDQVQPSEFGWTNVAGYNDYASRDLALREDAGRYECGTLNTVGIFGLRASMEFLLEVGQAEVQREVLSRADQIDRGVRAKGFEVLGPERTADSSSGIVSFRNPGEDCRVTVRRLKDAGILAAPRQGWIRTSPHFYISPGDIEKLLEEL